MIADQKKLELEEAQIKNVYNYLIIIERFDLIDLLAKASKKEIHVVRIKKMLVPRRPYHNTIINILKKNNVEIIYPNGII